MQEESETFEMFSSLYDKGLSALYELDLKARKLIKLGVSQTEIDAVKKIYVNHLGGGIDLTINKNNLILS